VSREPLDRHALGQRLSRLSNASLEELSRLTSAPATEHRARRIGFTGAPGAGKSTLLGHLIIHRADKGRCGVLAIDPSSPRTGGAILGDRIRMDELEGSSEFYIRSLASRNTSDGLADNVAEMLDTMDEFGFDEVMLETVGVGQAEYAARLQVDTLVLVLLPDSGDTVQAMKAGIMEMADILVVNKADLPGAQKMVTDIARIAALTARELGAWQPPILLASSSRPETIAVVSDAIDSHQAWLGTSRHGEAMRLRRDRYRLRRILERRLARLIETKHGTYFQRSLQDQLANLLADAIVELESPQPRRVP